MKIAAVQCTKCHVVIFSRAQHDFRHCKCKAIAVDGGFDYLRLIGNTKHMERKNLDLAVDAATLYDDWNKYKDKWGLHTVEDIEQLTTRRKHAVHKVRSKS